MGFTQRDAGIDDFSKFVYSCFVYVPDTVITTALAEASNWWATEGPDGGVSSSFTQGIIPFMVFGANAETMFDTAVGTGAVMPSCIGLSCRDETQASLFARFQYSTGNQGSVGVKSPEFINDFFAIGYPPFPTIGIGFDHVVDSPNVVPFSGGTWHHLLVSADLSGGSSVSVDTGGSTISFGTTCSFWWAFDDVNYDGKYLGPNAPGEFGQTPANGIASFWSMSNSSFAAGNLPVFGFPMGFPATADFPEHVYKVKMCGIQLFTGVTCDTSIESNRRAFVTDTITPVSPSAAAALLGKAPDVLFVTTEDWISGNNRGTAGAFTTTGTIRPFTPGP